MKYFLLTMVVALFYTEAFSQKKRTAAFNSYSSAGVVIGESDREYTVQTVNGVKYGNWFLGAGIGLDHYFIQTIPLFADLKRMYPVKKGAFFLYADAGGQIIPHAKQVITNYSSLREVPGLYLDLGLGYKIFVARRNSIFFSFGNTVKRIDQRTTTLDAIPQDISVTKYNLSRLSLRVGYQF